MKDSAVSTDTEKDIDPTTEEHTDEPKENQVPPKKPAKSG